MAKNKERGIMGRTESLDQQFWLVLGAGLPSLLPTLAIVVMGILILRRLPGK